MRDALWELASAVAGNVPIPGLDTCVVLIQQVDKAVQQVKLQRAECYHLVDLAARFLVCIVNAEKQRVSKGGTLKPTSSSASSVRTLVPSHYGQSSTNKTLRESSGGQRIVSRIFRHFHLLQCTSLQKQDAPAKSLADPHLDLPKAMLEVDDRLRGIKSVLERIQAMTEELQEYSFFKMYKESKTIMGTLNTLKDDLVREVNLFQFSTAIKLDQWLEQLSVAKQMDNAQIVQLGNDVQALAQEMKDRFQKTDESLHLILARQRMSNNEKYVSPDDLEYMDSPCYRQQLNTILAANKPWPSTMINDLSISLRELIRPGDDPIKADIYRANIQNVPTKELVVKVYRGIPEEVRNNLCRELEICSRLKHSNIISYYGINTRLNIKGEYSFNLVSEYCSQGSVFRYLDRVRHRRKTENPLPEPDLLKIILDVALALEYLHTPAEEGKVVVHGDIRPSKILITDDGTAKLSSFRRSKTLDRQEENAMRKATAGSDNLRWRAPEALRNYSFTEPLEDCFGLPSDVYGWALTATSILIDAIPFDKADTRFIGMKIIRGPPFYPDEAALLEPFGVQDLLERCWNVEPRKRPSISEVCSRLEEIRAFRTP